MKSSTNLTLIATILLASQAATAAPPTSTRADVTSTDMKAPARQPMTPEQVRQELGRTILSAVDVFN